MYIITEGVTVNVKYADEDIGLPIVVNFHLITRCYLWKNEAPVIILQRLKKVDIGLNLHSIL